GPGHGGGNVFRPRDVLRVAIVDRLGEAYLEGEVADRRAEDGRVGATHGPTRTCGRRHRDRDRANRRRAAVRDEDLYRAAGGQCPRAAGRWWKSSVRDRSP